MDRCVLWAGASYGPVRLMGRCVLWACASYGLVRLMGRCVLWVGASYGPVSLMGRCVLWAGASYGPVRLMGRCVLWAGASYGLVCLMGREIRYFLSKALTFGCSILVTVARVFILYFFPVKWNILQTEQQYVVVVSQFAVDMQNTFSKEALYIFYNMIHSHLPSPLRNAWPMFC
jgi:hypothetical protein